MALDISELRKLCIPKNIRITLHAAKRLEQRGIFLKDVMSCIMNEEIIEQHTFLALINGNLISKPEGRMHDDLFLLQR